MSKSNQYLSCEVTEDCIALLELTRPSKHNALSDGFIEALAEFFRKPPPAAKVVVMHTRGDNFCAGLDLSEHKERNPFEVLQHSQGWHRAFELIQFGGLPVVAVLKGAVIGGGLELAMATHVRVSEPSTFYQLPEGKRGIFVGGGASVRVARAIGAGRMTEMMLTGRTYDAQEGLNLGLAHYLVESNGGLAKGMELARAIASNAPLCNYAMLTAISRISDMSASDGFYTESLVAALAQTSDDAKKGIAAFLARKQRA